MNTNNKKRFMEKNTVRLNINTWKILNFWIQRVLYLLFLTALIIEK
jgi:hypothetical protein